MAESDNTQPIPAGPPEKGWYRLSEIAEEWSQEIGRTITNKEILHYGIFSKLSICVFAFDIRAHKNKRGTKENFLEGVPETISGLFKINQTDLLKIEATGESYINFFFDLDDDVSDLLQERWFTSQPPRITINDLVVLRKERDRFEKENRIGAYAGTMPDLNKPDRLDPRKETTYLNVIGAMLHILLNPPQDDKGNLKNINTQAAVIDEIVDLFGHKQGISERTLQDKFSAAKKSLDNS